MIPMAIKKATSQRRTNTTLIEIQSTWLPSSTPCNLNWRVFLATCRPRLSLLCFERLTRKCHENSDPAIFLKKDKHFLEKDLHCKLVSTLSRKMFCGHAMFKSCLWKNRGVFKFSVSEVWSLSFRGPSPVPVVPVTPATARTGHFCQKNLVAGTVTFVQLKSTVATV